MLVPKSHVELQPVSLRPVEYYFEPLTQARLATRFSAVARAARRPVPVPLIVSAIYGDLCRS